MVINLPGRKWHLLIDLERLSLSSHPGAVGAGMSIAYSIWFLSCSWLRGVCQESENSAEARFLHRNALLVSRAVSGKGMVGWRANLRLPKVTSGCCRGEKTVARAPKSACWVGAQAAPLMSAVTLAKLLSLPVPQFPPLWNHGSRLLWGLNGKMHIENAPLRTPKQEPLENGSVLDYKYRLNGRPWAGTVRTNKSSTCPPVKFLWTSLVHCVSFFSKTIT